MKVQKAPNQLRKISNLAVAPHRAFVVLRKKFETNLALESTWTSESQRT